MPMSGAPVVAAFICHIVFWAVVLLGAFSDALRPRSAITFVVLWSIGYFVLPRMFAVGDVVSIPFVSLVDVVLVLTVFKGDLRLS
jgi:hypothetical protein